MNSAKRNRKTRDSSSSESSGDVPPPQQLQKGRRVTRASAAKRIKQVRESSSSIPSQESPPKQEQSRENPSKKEPEDSYHIEQEAEARSYGATKLETTSNMGEDHAITGESIKSTPAAMLSLCDKVTELVQDKRLNLDDKERLSGSLRKMLTLDNEDAYNEEQINAIHSLRQYHSAAVAQSHVLVLDAVATVKKFLESEPSAVQLHPRFPAKPVNPKVQYARILRERGEKSGVLAVISAKFKDAPEDPDVIAAINQSTGESEAYSERLKDFVKDFKDDILPRQIPFINSLIRKHEAKAQQSTRKDDASSNGAKKRGRPRKSTAARTAFDLFKCQMEAKEKYARLIKTERDERIKAEFNELPKETMDILESLVGK